MESFRGSFPGGRRTGGGVSRNLFGLSTKNKGLEYLAQKQLDCRLKARNLRSQRSTDKFIISLQFDFFFYPEGI